MVYFILFLFGICIGSFLNVVIDRIPMGKSILFGRSHCDFCKKQLAWYDLVPIFSYLFLFGKCRYCHKKLSLQYPFVELCVGILFVALFFIENPITPFHYFLFFIDVWIISISFVLVVMDIKFRILPDVLLLPLFLFSLLRIVALSPANLPQALGIGVVSAVPLLLLYIFSQGRAMGFGDVKLIFILGFLLGFPNILICYYIAFLTGAIAGVILILGEKKKFHGTTIAFGPFLILGSVGAALFGEALWQFAKIFLGF